MSVDDQIHALLLGAFCIPLLVHVLFRGRRGNGYSRGYPPDGRGRQL